MSARWLYPSRREGLEIADARSWRLMAQAGRVTEHGSARDRRSVATPGDVTRAVVVSGADVPKKLRVAHRALGPTELDQVLVLTSDDAVVLALRLADVSHRAAASGDEMRLTSGVQAFVSELGLPLESATAQDVEALRETIPTGGAAQRLTRRLLVAQGALYVLGVIAVLLLALTQGSVDPPYAVAALLEAVTGVGLAAVLVVAFRRFREVASPPEPEGRRVVANLASPEPRWLSSAQLQLGRDDLVWSAAGREEWAPGVDRAGADTCAVGTDVVSFRRDGAAILEVPLAGLDPESLSEAAHVAGLKVVRDEPTLDIITEEIRRTAAADPLSQISGSRRGAFFASLGIFVMTGFLLLTTVLNPDPDVDRLSAVNIAGAVVAVGIFLTMAVVELRRRAWSRGIRRGRAPKSGN